MSSIETFENNPLRTLDSTLATQSNEWGALPQRELAKNANHITKRGLQPCVSRGYDLEDSWGDRIAESKLSWRVNAPRGAWTFLVPWTPIVVPPGVEQLELDVRAKLANGQSAYIMPITNEQAWNLGLRSTDSDFGVVTLAGSGSAATYPSTEGTWRFPIRATSTGENLVAVAVQTTGFTISLMGTARQVTQGGLIEANDADFPDYGAASVRERDDWARVEGLSDVTEVWRYDASGPTWTQLTNYSSDNGTGDKIFLDPQQVGDIIYFGFVTPPSGMLIDTNVAGGHSLTVAWEWSTGGTSYSAHTFLTNGQQVTAFQESAGTHRFNVWDIPTAGWERTTNGGNTTELYWARARVTAVTSTSATEAQLDYAKALGPTLMPFARILAGGSGGLASGYWLQTIGARVRQDPAGASQSVYITGYASELDVYALLIDNVMVPLRAG